MILLLSETHAALEDQMAEFLPGGAVAFIPSAPDPRRRSFSRMEKLYARLGAPLQYFDPAEAAWERCFEAPLLHLSGGPVIPFLDTLERVKAGAGLRAYRKNGGRIIAVSAGAMVLGRTLDLAKRFGDTDRSRPGLGILPFDIFPHADEEFPYPRDLLRLPEEGSALWDEKNLELRGGAVLQKKTI